MKTKRNLCDMPGDFLFGPRPFVIYVPRPRRRGVFASSCRSFILLPKTVVGGCWCQLCTMVLHFRATTLLLPLFLLLLLVRSLMTMTVLMALILILHRLWSPPTISLVTNKKGNEIGMSCAKSQTDIHPPTQCYFLSQCSTVIKLTTDHPSCLICRQEM